MQQFYLFKFCVLLLLSIQPVSGQTTKEASVYSWFDQVVGRSNTGIFNAVEYVEKHRTINEHHKFFLSEAFLPGSIVYEDQPYFELEMKYNVFDDLLQVKVPNRGNTAIFQLLPEKVEQFNIAGRSFMNLRQQGGFHENIFETEGLVLFVKHRRSLKKVQDKQFVYYEFHEEKRDYLLKYKDAYHQIDSRGDIIDLFPEEKKSIRSFYSSRRSLRKSDPDLFFQQLFQLLSQA